MRWIRDTALLALGVLLGVILTASWRQPELARAQAKAGGAEQRLRDLKLTLPKVSPPKGATLVPAVRVGDLIFLSGQGPRKDDGGAWVGRLGLDTDIKQGQAAARQIGLQMLATLRDELGSLDKVQRVVKTLGMVNATADFKQHPQVINGFSDLMVEVFGEEAGKGARSAVGMASLPGGIPVEVEAIFQVKK